MKESKTNAMRMLDKEKVSYQVLTYPHGKEAVDGEQVAKLLNQDPAMVFKTLVTMANTKEYFVFVIPVNKELDVKKCARIANVKSIEMIHVKDIQKLTGYIRGGCSPIGMKKAYRTFLHETCKVYENIMFSGGKIGCQIRMNPLDLLRMIQGETADLVK